MLNSTEHGIYPAHECKNANNSRMNTICKSLKARKIITFQHYSLYEKLKCYAQLS